MATKKQKREKAEAKRNEYLAEIHRSGLESLQKERMRRKEIELGEWEKNHNKNHSMKKLIEECPHCQSLMRLHNIPGKKKLKNNTKPSRKTNRRTTLKENI